MRLFIATRFDGEFLDWLSWICGRLKREIDGNIKWVKPENLHITYSFLGDVPESVRADIIESMKLVEARKFFISGENLGCFPSLSKPNIIWLGVNEGSDKLKEISDELRLNLSGKGFEFKKDFLPHITMARVKGRIRSDMREVFDNARCLFNEKPVFTVSAVELFESKLCSSGPVYESVYKMDLT